MKMIKFLPILIILALIGCKKDPYKEIGPKYDLITGINGEWQISAVEILDLTLPVPEGRDIGDFYTSQPNPIGLSFNSGDQTYTVVNNETAGNIFGQSGKYAFDKADYPKELWLMSGTDTITLGLMNMVRVIDPYMGLQYTRDLCGDMYAQYNYTFKRMK